MKMISVKKTSIKKKVIIFFIDNNSMSRNKLKKKYIYIVKRSYDKIFVGGLHKLEQKYVFRNIFYLFIFFLL